MVESRFSKAVKRKAKEDKSSRKMAKIHRGARPYRGLLSGKYWEAEIARLPKPKAPKRRTPFEEEKNEKRLKVFGPRLPIVTSVYDATKMIDRVFPGIQVAINSGNKEEVIKIMSGFQARTASLKWDDVGTLFTATAGIMNRINEASHNNYDIVKTAALAREAIIKYKLGETSSLNEAYGYIRYMTELMKNKNVVLATLPDANLKGAIAGVNKDTAEQIVNERKAEEERLQFEEAIKVGKANEEQARKDKEAALKMYKEQEMIKKQPETVENVEAKRKQDREAEIKQELASRDYGENQAKEAMIHRVTKANEAALGKLNTNIKNGVFGSAKRAVIEAALESVGNSTKKAQEECSKSDAEAKKALNSVMEALPTFLEDGERKVKDVVENNTDYNDYETKMRDVIENIKEEQAQIVQLNDQIEDKKEEVTAYKKLASDAVQKRINGNAEATGAIYRKKQEEAAQELRNREKTQREILERLKANQAKKAALVQKQNTIHQEQQTLSDLKNTAPLAQDLIDQGNKLYEQELQENLAQVNNLAVGLQENKNLNVVGNSIIENHSVIKDAPKEVVNGNLKNVIDTTLHEVVMEEEKIDEEYDKEVEKAQRQELKKTGDRRKVVETAAGKKARIQDTVRAIFKAQDKRDKAKAEIRKKIQQIDNPLRNLQKAKLEFNVGGEPMELDTYEPYKASSQVPVAIPNATFTNLRSAPATLSAMNAALQAPGFVLEGPKDTRVKRSSMRNVTKGGFVVGSRPDPLLNIDFWKNLYNKRK